MNGILIRKKGFEPVTTNKFRKEVCSICGDNCNNKEIINCIEEWD